MDDSAKVNEEDEEEKIGFIEDFFMDKDFRGKEETAMLLDAIKSLAWAQGCNKCLIKADNSKNGLKFDQCSFMKEQEDDEMDFTQQGMQDAFLVLHKEAN
jgi:hypothetical protein